MKCNEIFIMNRTKDKAEEIKKVFTQIHVKNWGEKVDFDLIINTQALD